MLERTDAITKEVLEPIVFVVAYPTVCGCVGFIKAMSLNAWGIT